MPKTLSENRSAGRSQPASAPSRRTRFIQGVVLGYASHALMLVTGLILTPFLIKRVGEHDFGLWLIMAQLLGYLSLMDIGVLAIFPREVARASAAVRKNADYREVAEVFHAFRVLTLWQTPLVLIACLLLWLLLPATWLAMSWPLAFFLAAFTLHFPLRIFYSLLYALQDQVFFGLLSIGTWAAGTLLTLCLVLRGEKLSAFVAGWILTQTLMVLASAVRAYVRYPQVISFRGSPVTWKTAKKYLKQSSWISVGQISSVFLGGSDIAILGRILGPTAVVPYAMTAKLTTASRNLPNQLMHTAFPALTEARAGESKEKLREILTALVQLLLLFSGGLVCIVLVMNQTFVGWWVGRSYFGGALLTLAFLIDMLVRHCTTGLAFSLFSFGKEREFSIVSLCDGLVTVGLSAFFCWQWGPIGVPLGSITSACLISLPFTLHVLARELFTSVATLIIPFYSWAWRLVLALLTIYFGLRLWQPASLPIAGLFGIGVGLSYLVLMRPVVMKGPLHKYCPSKYRRLLNITPCDNSP